MKTHDSATWFRQPVVWVGAAILFASIAGCIVTFVVAARYADTPVETASGTAFKIPPTRAALASPQGASALGRPGGAEIPPKRAALASPQGASALGRPGGAEIPLRNAHDKP